MSLYQLANPNHDVTAMQCDVLKPLREGGAIRNAVLFLLGCLLLALATFGAQAQTRPVITTQPVGGTNLTATEITFTVVATGTAPLRYQWFINLTNRLIGSTNSTLTYTNLGAFQEGLYTVVITNVAGAVTSNPVFLDMLVPPLVTGQPTNQVRPVGGTAVFSATATGDPVLRYQWFKNVIDELVGETNATLVLTNLQVTNSGTYQVEVSNDHDTVNSVEALLTVKHPPSIVADPVNVAVPSGGTATFNVTEGGDGPFFYQWLFNGTNILAAATNQSLILTDVQLPQTGNYRVRVSTDVGAVTSAPAALLVLQAPTISSQPSSLTLVAGTTANFSVAAVGTQPLGYQWYFNRTNTLPGGTAAGITIENAQPANSGIYSVVVSNQSGSVTSINASLSVFVPPQILAQPTNLTVRSGQPASFAVTASGTTPLIYRWYFNETNLLVGANNSSITLSSAALANAGTYTVSVSNFAGLVTSQPGQLVVQSAPVIVQHPASRTVVAGTDVTFSVQAIGDAPFGYQWFLNTATTIPGATNSSFSILNAQTASNGRYSVRVTNTLGSANSLEAVLSVKRPPVIAQDPVSVTVTQGVVATFSVVATGDEPFVYRWLHNGANAMPGTNGAVLLIQGQSNDAGTYSVVVSNEVGSATSAEAILTVRVPPTILAQPEDVYVRPGGDVTFSVTAAGDAPLTYQWSRGGTEQIPDATNATLTIQGVEAGPDATYSVAISNDFGGVVSRAAALRIRTPPSIVVAPVSVTSTQGQAAEFTVGVAGDGPFNYQWFFNGSTPLVGSTGASLNFANVAPSEAGQYSVVVTNVVGSVTSAPVELTVLLLPVIVTQPVSLVLTQGQSANFQVVATSDTPLGYDWRRGGVSLGANQPAFGLASVVPGDAGAYDVAVANTYGTVTSVVATLTVFGFDFGDAPDAEYPTLLASDGARHVVVAGVFLGAGVDAELDGQPSPDAAADGDDEDGVRFSGPLRVGQGVSVEVVASTNGFLSAWIDFNHASGWADSGEEVLTLVPVVAGTNLLPVNIPSGAQLGSTFARFRFTTTGGALAPSGPALDGEVEDYTITVEPASDLRLTQTFSATAVPAGSSATLVVSVTNSGPSTATAVFLTNQLSRHSTFVSAASSLGSCVHAGGMVICELGNLDPGQAAEVTIDLLAGSGTNRVQSSLRGAVFDPTPADGTAAVVGTVTLPQYANGEIIILPLPDSGRATPYPSPIEVAGATTAVQKVTVTLRGLNHDFPADMDILLVAPNGRAVVLMSDAGSDTPILDATVTFDDDALNLLPDSLPAITTGSYRPANLPPLNDVFPSPAPAGPYAEELSAFAGINPNGVWSLYVVDDALDNGTSPTPGFIADGWTLNILTSEMLSDIGVSATASPSVASVGQPITNSVIVTNHGPTATTVSLRGVLDSGLTFLSATTPQGSCSHAAGVVTCELGEMPVGAAIAVEVRVAGTTGGSLGSVFTAGSLGLDLNDANNSASPATSVLPVADLSVSLGSASASVLVHEPVSIFVTITNRGPNNASGVLLTNQLPAGATFVNAIGASGACAIEAGVAVCPVADLGAGASVVVEIRLFAGSVGINTFTAAVAAQEEDAVLSNNSRTVTFTANPAADLVLTTTTTSSIVPLGRDWIILHSITNLGPLSGDAMLSSTLPAGMSFQTAVSLQGSCTNLGGAIGCSFPNLASGASATVTITARADLLGAFTNHAAVSGSLPDFNPGNNASTVSATVVPSADLAVSITNRPNPVWQGDNTIVTVAVTNLGPSSATNVVLTNFLPTGVTFISSAASQGSCVRQGDVLRCDVSSLASGGGVVVTVVLRPALPGNVVFSSVASSAVVDPLTANNPAQLTMRVISATTIAANSAPVTTPLLGLANPYPSTITVAGVTNSIFRMRVTLLGLSHSYSDDLDVLLVGPDGRATLLMSDVGGEFTMNNVTLTFDDGATNALGDFNSVLTGTYRPTNFGFETDGFAAPAPVGPYATNLSMFNGTDPNGTWSLYIMDDADKDSGLLSGGWRLSFVAGDPIVDLAVAQTVSTNPAAVGSNVVFTYTVTNLGPSPAPAVMLTNPIPDGLVVSTYLNPHGGCSVVSNTLVCTLGTIGSNGVATVSVTASAVASGLLTNVVSVSSGGADFQPLNNTSRLPVVFDLPPTFVAQPVSVTVNPGGTAEFVASVIGAETLLFQWQKDGQNLPGAVGPSLTVENVGGANVGSYRLRVVNHVGVALSEPARLRMTGPPVVSAIADVTIDEDTDTGALAFSLVDYDTDVATVLLAGESSNPALVLPSGIAFVGTGASRTVRVTPLANASGTAIIAVIAADLAGASSTNVFQLTVLPVIDPIVILLQPRNYLSVTGSTVQLSVTATSALPVAYQWEKDGLPLPGAVQSTLTLVGLDATNAGSYRVLLSNADANLASATATVQVTDQLPSPNIISISRGGTNATVTFSTAVGLNYTLEYRDDFNVPGWTALGSVPGTGNVESLIDPVATNPQRFYRIRAD